MTNEVSHFSSEVVRFMEERQRALVKKNLPKECGRHRGQKKSFC